MADKKLSDQDQRLYAKMSQSANTGRMYYEVIARLSHAAQAFVSMQKVQAAQPESNSDSDNGDQKCSRKKRRLFTPQEREVITLYFEQYI